MFRTDVPNFNITKKKQKKKKINQKKKGVSEKKSQKKKTYTYTCNNVYKKAWDGLRIEKATRKKILI